MLERLLLLRAAVQGQIQKDELTLVSSEWEMMEHISSVLAPKKQNTETLCGSRYPTMGMVYPMLKSLLDRVLNERRNLSPNGVIKLFKEKIKMKLEADLKENNQEILMQICAYVDPR